jgi:DNA-binding NarL/FixJ family response regulator
MNNHIPPTKLLFIDDDESSFEAWQSMATILSSLPPITFYHAADASDALHMLDKIQPDVIVLNLDDNLVDERAVFIDSLFGDYPPVVVPMEDDVSSSAMSDKLIYLSNCSSIEGIHKTLLTAATAAKKPVEPSGVTYAVH